MESTGFARDFGGPAGRPERRLVASALLALLVGCNSDAPGPGTDAAGTDQRTRRCVDCGGAYVWWDGDGTIDCFGLCDPPTVYADSSCTKPLACVGGHFGLVDMSSSGDLAR